jgi:xylulose-5-phosphate/fructose-6-phosphate phosphoketolase
MGNATEAFLKISYVAEHGEDMPEISGWQWGQAGPRARPTGSTEADNV